MKTRFHGLFLCAASVGMAACAAFEPTLPQRQIEQARSADGVARDPFQQPEVDLSAPDLPESLAVLQAEASVATRPPRSLIGGSEPVSLELRGTNLAQALHLIAEMGHVNIYLGPGLDRPIDASFPQVVLDDALSALLARNGLRMHEEPAGIFWVETADGSEAAVGTFTAQSIDALEILPQLTALVGLSSQVIVDGSQNLIVVKGPRRDVDLVADFLKHADRLKRQVLMEVRIVEALLTDEFELGISGILDGSINGDALQLTQALSTPDQSFSLQFTSSNLDATLQAVAKHVGIQLVSSPKVLAVTGTEAQIEVIEEIPYINTTTTTTGTTGGVGSQVAEEVLFKEAGIKLKVTPTVQEHGVLQIKIDQDFSEVTGYFNEIPVLDSRKLSSVFLVPDKGTLVLGGLMQKRRSQTDKGVPGLMDLPLIGRLFRSDEDQGRHRELLVFITPRILDFEQARNLATRYQDRFEQRVRSMGMGPELKAPQGQDR